MCSVNGRNLDAAAPRCEICLLAGGLSSRLGTDKSRLRLGSRTLLGRVRAAANATGLPTRVIRADLVPRCGPLGGVYTALATSRAETLLFLPCDMPFLSAELLKALIRRLRGGKKALFVEANGRIGFPFLLRRTTVAVVQRQLAGGNFSLHTLARRLRARIIRLPHRRARELFNVNTADDWKTARERWRHMMNKGWSQKNIQHPTSNIEL